MKMDSENQNGPEILQNSNVILIYDHYNVKSETLLLDLEEYLLLNSQQIRINNQNCSRQPQSKKRTSLSKDMNKQRAS